MKPLYALFFLGCLGPFCGAQQTFDNTLMPQPSRLKVESGLLPVTSQFTAVTNSYHDERLDGAITRALDHLKDKTGIEMPDTVGRGSSGQFVISVDGGGEAVQSVNEDESYSLDVTPMGVRLDAATDVGAIHGLETLLQLVQPSGGEYVLPTVSIQDSPRFRWRGLMVDCSRHFETVKVLERTLDGMAAVKMNVFHWHLSDDQGFRIESKVFPKLTELGSDGKYYTQDQAREIVQYARDRGIRVVPEFDMPGHSSAWFVGYPDLASGPGPFHIETHFGIFDPTMDPTRESTFAFLDRFIAEMAKIFPDEYIHIGGDENNGNEWKHNQEIQAFMQAHKLTDTAALQAYFNQRLMKILRAHGKKMIGWDEVLAPGLPKDVVVQSWRGFDSLAGGARQGYAGILSAGYYLDHMDTAAEHYAVDPIPANNHLTPEERDRILGGEACMFGEYVDSRNIDSRIWPRTAAIAERLWSPQSVQNVDDMYRRLRVESLRLEGLGLAVVSQEDTSLRQLAGTENIDPLRVFAAATEPVIFDDRDAYTEKHDITTLTPLDHLVDALRPDPPSRHALELLVNAYLEAPRQRDEQSQQLTALFRSWVDSKPGVMRLMANSPLLAPAEPREIQLAELGAMGLRALSCLSAGQTCTESWKAAELKELQQDSLPVDLTRFAVIEPVRELVNAVHVTAEGE